MTYPAVIILVALGAFTFLMFGVMPTFTDMFQDFGRNMPLPAQLLMNTGDFIKSHVLLILLSLILVVGILRVFVRSEKGKWIIDVLKLKIPLIGQIVKKVSVSRFARTLGTLLQSGVSLLEALHVTSQSSGNRVFQKQILRMKEMAERGEAMEKSIAGSDLFPELVVQMISVGEETAELPGMLTRTAEFYETEVDAAIEALTSIIEPVIIVVLGIVLGGMMITIYMQIFDLMNVIQ
jgi:type IV pilus assembly protein PilC